MQVDAAQEIEQDDAESTYAPKIDRASAQLHFTRDAVTVSRVIRAFDPRPGAHTTLAGAAVKCFGVRIIAVNDDAITDDALRASRPGTIRTVDGDGLVVRCGDGAVRIAQLQPAGKGRLAPLDLMRGRGLQVGDRFDDSEGTGYLSAHDAAGGI